VIGEIYRVERQDSQYMTMRARAFEFVARECVSVLLGGLAYQKGTPHIINIIHIYVFLIFCFIPYTLITVFEREYALYIYTGVMGAIFTIAKASNHTLHLLLSGSRPLDAQDRNLAPR
jgi:hypothetical protein